MFEQDNMGQQKIDNALNEIREKVAEIKRIEKEVSKLLTMI